MKIFSVLVGLIFAAVVSLSYADSFEQHVVPVYNGPSAKPDFQSLQGSSDYKTRVLDGIKQGVSFGGHFTIVTFGCGTECTISFLVDVKSGKIFDFPLGGEKYRMLSLDYHPDSTLIKANWTESYDKPTCVHQELVLQGTAFKILSKTKTAGECNK